MLEEMDKKTILTILWIVIVIVSILVVLNLAIFNNLPEKDEEIAPLEKRESAAKNQSIEHELPAKKDNKAITVNFSDISDSNNQFAFDLYSKLSEEEGNIFFSPWSITAALAMTYEGARGETANEIARTLHFPEDYGLLRLSYVELNSKINSKDSKYNLSTANAFWVQKDFGILDEYVNVLQKYYDASANLVDFIKATEEARQTINKWVEDKTNDKIKDLIPVGVLDAATRLVLTNAIYFKANWLVQFDKEETKDEEFKVNNEKTVIVPIMRYTESRFNYAETDESQILELLYEGNNLSMIILLPKNDDLEKVESSLSTVKFTEWVTKLKEQNVDVFIPRFTFDSKYFLSKNLKEMGILSSFDPLEADFSGIDGKKDLVISDVIHQAFVDVNEEGTEAAAATAVVIGIISIPPPTPIFRADHPFIFIIQERENNTILFIGRVSDPTS